MTQIKDPQLDYLHNRMKETCIHANTTRQGSNHFSRKLTCRDCGALLKDELTMEGRLAKDKKTGKDLGYDPQLMSRDAEYEEFLRWKTMRGHNSPVRQSPRRRLFEGW